MPNLIARPLCAGALLALFATTPSPLVAQQKPVAGPRPSAAVLTALVDSVVKANALSKGVPSVSVAVMRGDETLVQRAWGQADRASGRAADPMTVYALGSNAKQLTAALVMKLVDRGRLTLGDSIGRHLPGLRPDWRPITIEQLLNHTSGLQRGGFVDQSRMEEDVSGDTIIARAARDSMAARPGTSFVYSNTGYVVLRVLIEKLYGKPYAAALRDEITRPLGLTTLRYCADAEARSMATGHLRSPDDGTISPAPTPHASQMLGASGICSTAADLAKWSRALHGGRVLSEGSYKAMTTPRGVAIPLRYGFGLSVDPAPWGGPAMTHGGFDVSGYTSHQGWYPADSLSVAILYNAFARLPDGGTHVVAAVALGHTPPATRNPAPEPAIATTPTPAATLAPAPAIGIVGDEARRQFVGEYQLRPGAVFTVDFKAGSFVLTTPGGETMPLVHQSGATYAFGAAASGTTVTFLADAEGKVVGFAARDGGSPERRLRKIR